MPGDPPWSVASYYENYPLRTSNKELRCQAVPSRTPPKATLAGPFRFSSSIPSITETGDELDASVLLLRLHSGQTKGRVRIFIIVIAIWTWIHSVVLA